ncbi:hypothetical protein LV716_09255 [Flagellimonas sp. HMM57]|uniref:hypothetical protein n=1 Tax=Flagellimonas sp. HMM57 TaxID=2905121 RepID=UPI001F200845|nr:hypothetical protein [Flagellimonas sp. HMM57]UII74453.1 hypothetical protein LV716_09255 [Flagellimonas sp. HMM57]
MEKRGSSKPTTARGINTFTWDLRYPGATEFEGMIIWSARPTRGPKAPLGTYKVRMKSGDYEQTYPFEVHINPNLKGITKADLDEQFTLANDIMEKTTAANEAVIKIRKIKTRIDSSKAKITAKAMKRTVIPFLEKITAVEEELYQVKNQSGQDPLNFPIKLNNRLASLRRSVENGDAKPTDGAYKVFKKLSAELEEHLGNLNGVLAKDVSKINAILEANGADQIEVSK